MKKSIKNFMKSWLLPRGIVEAKQKISKERAERQLLASMPYLQNNLQLKDKHQGQRCFILCCGPSINTQDLTLLKDEVCISVSNFYVHKDNETIRPKYHCVPDVLVAHANYFTEEYVINWFHEMDRKINGASILLSCNGKDKELVESHKLFTNREINYFSTHGNWQDLHNVGIDLTRFIFPAQSVSVIALQAAIYMGFKDIYLLGCDHDYLLHMYESRHFYEENESVLASQPDYSEWKESTYASVIRDQFYLWEQYRSLLSYAQEYQINIFNATNGGLLDVFPRVKYEKLF